MVNWTNEEGTRFAPAMLASGVFAGRHDQDWAYDRVTVKERNLVMNLNGSDGSVMRRSVKKNACHVRAAY